MSRAGQRPDRAAIWQGMALLQLAVCGEMIVVPRAIPGSAPAGYFSALMFGPLLSLLGLLAGEVALPARARAATLTWLLFSGGGLAAVILASAVHRMDRVVDVGYAACLPVCALAAWGLRPRDNPDVNIAGGGSTSHMDLRIRARLIWYGMVLFVLGLVTKLIMYFMVNPRMAIASHLVALMAGIFLILAGVLWSSMDLPRRVQGPASWLILFSCYTAWGSMFISSLFGCNRTTPFASSGVAGGLKWQEDLTDSIYMAFFVTIVLSGMVMLWGLRRGAAAADRQP